MIPGFEDIPRGPGCDEEREDGTGDVRAAWRVDRDGVRDVKRSSGSVPKESDGMWFGSDWAPFYIALAGDRVAVAPPSGPRAGFGGRHRVIL